jgi:hypothetical protein
MSAVKILLGLFTLAVVVIMIGDVTTRKEPVQPLMTSSAFSDITMRPDHSIELNLKLHNKGMRTGYSSRLSMEEPEPQTYIANNNTTKFILSRGRRCTKMVAFM